MPELQMLVYKLKKKDVLLMKDHLLL